MRRANELAQVPIASISAAVDYDMAADGEHQPSIDTPALGLTEDPT